MNGIAPGYLKSEVSIANHTGHGTRSGNRACFVPRVNSYAILIFFFYTVIKQWNALLSATQLISNKQTFKSEVKKLLWMKHRQMDKEIYMYIFLLKSLILFVLLYIFINVIFILYYCTAVF